MKTQKSWDNFYMSIARKVAELSYADDHKVGCVIVRNDNILAFSYNGTYPGSNNDTQVDKSLVYHAEATALLKLLREGRSPEAATMYVTMSPCIECAKLIAQSGISRLVYGYEYKCTKGLEFLKGKVALQTQDQHSILISEGELHKMGYL